MTHRPGIVAAEHSVQTYEGPAAELHPRLVEAAAGKNVWVVGGGEVARQFVDAGLVDEMIVSYAPCTLGAGSRVLPMRSGGRWCPRPSTVISCARTGVGFRPRPHPDVG